ASRPRKGPCPPDRSSHVHIPIFFLPGVRTRALVRGDHMSDPASRLPARPSVAQLRKQAKELLRAFRSGDAVARERFRAIVPRFASANESAVLADAQFVIAREAGFPNWAELVRHAESVNPTPTRGPALPLIRPIEMTASPSITLSDGDVASSDEVYGIFVAACAGTPRSPRTSTTTRRRFTSRCARGFSTSCGSFSSTEPTRPIARTRMATRC